MITNNYYPDPEPQDSRPYHDIAGLLAPDAGPLVIGQNAALARLNAIFHVHARRVGRTPLVVNIGASGCGKAHVVRQTAAFHGRPVAEIDLPPWSPVGDIVQIAFTLLRSRNLADASAIEDAVVMVRCRSDKQAESVAAQAAAFLPESFVIDGNKITVDPARWLLVINLMLDESASQHVVLDRWNRLAFPAYVTAFEELSRRDLHDILLEGGLFAKLKQRVHAFGGDAEIEFSEMAIRQILDKQDKCYPGTGAHGLAKVLDEITLQIFESVAAAQVRQERSSNERSDHSMHL